MADTVDGGISEENGAVGAKGLGRNTKHRRKHEKAPSLLLVMSTFLPVPPTGGIDLQGGCNSGLGHQSPIWLCLRPRCLGPSSAGPPH